MTELTREQALEILHPSKTGFVGRNNDGSPEVIRMTTSTDYPPTVQLDGSFNKEELQALLFFLEEEEKQQGTPLQETTVSAIDAMVNRFLGWPLPKTFHPDCGISFKPLNHPHSWPVGTNLFTAIEAKEMFLHCLGKNGKE